MNLLSKNKHKIIKLLSAMLIAVFIMPIMISQPLVHGANGWDENTHTGTFKCTGCNNGQIYGGVCYYYGCYDCPGHYIGVWSKYPGGVKARCNNCFGDNTYFDHEEDTYNTHSACDGTGKITQTDFVSPALATKKSADAENLAYTGQDVTVTATATDNLSGVNWSSAQWTMTGTTSNTQTGGNTFIVPNTAGVVTVTCKVKDNAGNWSSVQSIDVVTKQHQSALAVANPTSCTYGDVVTLEVTGGTTNEPLQYELLIGNATLNNNVVTPTSSGNVSVKITMPGNDLYFPVDITYTLTVNPKEVIVQGDVNFADKEYDGTTSAAVKNNTLSLSGVINSDNVALDEPIGTFAGKTIGEQVISVAPLSLSGTDIGNYTLTQPMFPEKKATITKKDLTVADVAIKDKIYDSTNKAEFITTPKLNGVAVGDDVTLSVGTPTFADENIGENKTVNCTAFIIDGADIGNYNLIQPAGLTANITPIKLTVGDFTVDNKVYDGTNKATINALPILVVDNVLVDEIVTLKGYTATFADKTVAKDKTVDVAFALDGADCGNYIVNNITTKTADITAKELTVIDTDIKDKEYDKTNTAEFAKTPQLSGLIANDDVVLSPGTPTFIDEIISTEKQVNCTAFTINGADIGNYTLIQPTGLKADITQKTIKIIPKSATKKVGDAEPTLSYTFEPALFDSDKIVGNISRVVGEKAGKYGFTLGTLSADNIYKLVLDTTPKFAIEKSETTINLVAEKNENIPVNISLIAEVEDFTLGNIEFYLDGRLLSRKTLVNRQAVFTFKPLKPGRYTVTAKLTNSDNYNDAESRSCEFTIDIDELQLSKPPVINDNNNNGNKKPVIRPPEKVEEIKPVNPPKGNDFDIDYDSDNDYQVVYGEDDGFTDFEPAFDVEDNATITKVELPNIIINKDDNRNDFGYNLEDAEPELLVVQVDGQEVNIDVKGKTKKSVVGYYNAKLFLRNTEIEPYDEVTVAIPITQDMEKYKGFEAIGENGEVVTCEVKAAEAVFKTDKLGNFVLVADEKDTFGDFLVKLLLFIIIVGAVTFLIFFISKKRKQDDENNDED